MKPDDNWKETRLLCDDISNLLDIPRGVSEDYLTVLENLIIHKFAEAVCLEEDCRGKDFSIELPYLGSLIVSIDSKNHMSVNFAVRSAFYKKLRAAYTRKESPLTSQMYSILGDLLIEKMEEGEIDCES